MSFLAAGAILFVIGLAYAVLLKRKLAETMILATVTIVFILYCFGLVNVRGVLLYGIYFITALAVLGLALIIYKQYKEPDTLKNAQLLQGSLLYIGFFIISLYFSYGRFVHFWDEFSLWGTIVKHFYFADALGTTPHPNYEVFIVTYVPGTGLFQYFFSRFSNQFVEHNLFIAFNMLYFCLIMPLVKDLFSRKKWLPQLCLLVILLVLPTMADHFFYSTIYVDTILGVLFGLSLLYYFVYRYEESLYGILMVTATVSMMVLTKDMGLLLAVGIFGIIIVDMLFFKRKALRLISSQTPGLLNKSGKLLLLLLPLLCTVFFRVSWANLTAFLDDKSVESAVTAGYLGNLLSGQLEPYQQYTMSRFINATIYSNVANFKMSVVVFSLLFVMVTFLLAFLLKKRSENLRIMTSSLILTIGLYCYHVVTLLVMFFIFSEWESVRLAGYDRYTSTYMLGMLMFLLVFPATDNDIKKKFSFKKLVRILFPDGPLKVKDYLSGAREIAVTVLVAGLALYVFIASLHPARVAFLVPFADTPLYTERGTADSAEKWLPYLSEDRALLIDQGSTGLALWIMRYELMPYVGLANNSGLGNHGKDWSINTEFYHDDDQWTFVITPEDWEQYVLSRDIKLVYVFNSDDVLENVYGMFFPDGVQSDMVYRVQNDNGKMLLIPVAN